MIKIVQTLKKLNLGLTRDDTVELKSCFQDWQKAFKIESERIQSALNDPGLKLHHIGSTSIPSILAKPILDILIEAPSVDAFDQHRQALELLGYEYKGEYGISGRRYCVLYNNEKTIGYVHIHSFAAGHPEIENHLLFRDYLTTFPERAAAYQALKLDLLNQTGMNRAKYTELKSDLIKALLTRPRFGKSMNIEIVRASVGDAENIRLVYADAYRENRELGFPASAETATVQDITHWIVNDRVWIAKQDVKTVGAVRLRESDPNFPMLGRLAVSSPSKGAGIGKRLIETAEAFARQHGCKGIDLSVAENHPFLSKFYLKQGYVILGPRNPQHHLYKEIVMRKVF
jgi:GrpB-like predicted nucleotidyltransferase (UPF0157 family)/predicted N-acetyltransferase YhbS